MKAASKYKKYGMNVSATCLNLLHGLPFSPFYAGIGHVLMFHRVVKNIGENRIWSNSFLEVTESYFEDVIKYYKRLNYKFVSIDELHHILNNESKMADKVVHFTFDDGYKDNLYNALPILEKHNVPATLYVTNDFPDKRAILWWYCLEEVILKNDNLEFEFQGQSLKYKTESNQEKESAFEEIHHLIQNVNSGTIEEKSNSIFAQLDMNVMEFVEKYALSWDEIKQISQHDLISIGAHTKSHLNLAQLNKEELVTEIDIARRELEKKLNLEINHFAYPFGGIEQVSKLAIEVLKEANFQTAVTTYSSNLHLDNVQNILELPRIAVGMSMNKATFDLIRHGVIPCIRNKGKQIITL